MPATLLNPDPYENTGAEAPPLGDKYWYPLYEKLCELDVPAHIHGTTSHSERTTVHACISSMKRRSPCTVS